MDLKTALKDATTALRNLDGAVAETINELTRKAEREAEAAEAVHRHEVVKLEEKITELEERIEVLEEAEALIEDVYTIERKGLLDTASPLKRLAFEKLAERWDSLTNAELEDLETLLDGKLNYL